MSGCKRDCFWIVDSKIIFDFCSFHRIWTSGLCVKPRQVMWFGPSILLIRTDLSQTWPGVECTTVSTEQYRAGNCDLTRSVSAIYGIVCPNVLFWKCQHRFTRTYSNWFTIMRKQRTKINKSNRHDHNYQIVISPFLILFCVHTNTSAFIAFLNKKKLATM